MKIAGKKKHTLISNFKQPMIAFMVTLLFFLVIFIIKEVFPFGDNSFMYMDMYHQYVPFMEELWNKLHDGQEFFYSYRVGIGSDFMALYVYYLASPIHFLIYFIPKDYIIEAVTYFCVLKLSICSFTACYYLQERFRAKGYEKIWFALLYSTCGFMCAYNWNVMWLDACMLTPLVLLGLEKLVKERKCGLYCISLACTIYVNYYISILLCLFLILYFVILLINDRFHIKKVLDFAIFSLLAGGMAAVLLLPEVCAILQTSFGKAEFPKTLKAYFSIFDVLARHGVNVAAERGLNHWPNIYCGALVFLLVPCYLLCKEISNKKKVCTFLVLLVFLLGFSTNVFEFVWHGLNYPDSLPGRQSFIYCFLVLTICYEAYLHLDSIQFNSFRSIYVGSMIFLILCEKLAAPEQFGRKEFMVTVLFVTVYALILYFYKEKKVHFVRVGLGIFLSVVIITETGINSFNTSLGVTDRNAYLENQKDFDVLAQKVREDRGDNAFYRIEKFTKKTKNDGILGNFSSASLFSSTLNSKVSNMYEPLGMRYSKVFYCFEGATALIAPMFHVDYMFAIEKEDEEEKKVIPGNEANDIFEYVDRSGNVSLYEYKYKLPFGYVAPYGYDMNTEELYGIRLQNQMVRELGINDSLFIKAENKSGTGELNFYAEKDGVYYMVLTTGGIKKLEINGEHKRSYSDLKKKSVIYIGAMKSGEHISIKKTEKDVESKNVSLDIYYLNTPVLEQALSRLSENHLENVTYDNTHINGHLSLPERGRLILDIADEDGWCVKVNGEEVKQQRFGDCFIALDLEAGEYDISLTFTPKGLKEGIVISGISILVYAAIMIMKTRKRKKHRMY